MISDSSFDRSLSTRSYRKKKKIVEANKGLARVTIVTYKRLCKKKDRLRFLEKRVSRAYKSRRVESTEKEREEERREGKEKSKKKKKKRKR